MTGGIFWLEILALCVVPILGFLGSIKLGCWIEENWPKWMEQLRWLQAPYEPSYEEYKKGAKVKRP